MSYQLQSKEEFLKFLNTYTTTHPFELNAIPEIDNLSDLYSFFLKNRNTSLSLNLYRNLNSIIKDKFEINANLISFNDKNKSHYISENNIQSLELIIKDRYLSYLNSRPENISDEEFYKLAVIVNKAFPYVISDLINNHISAEDFKEQLTFIRNKVDETIDMALNHRTNESNEEIIDIGSAIYIVFKELFPQLDVYIPGRTKSSKSIIDNINYEFEKSLENLTPSNAYNGISYSDIEKNFNLNGAQTDFTGFTIVLSNTDDVIHFDKNDPSFNEFHELRKKRIDNISFIHSIENILTYDIYKLSYEDLLQIQIELLIRLRDCTFEECTEEYIGDYTFEKPTEKVKGTSFAKVLENTINLYKNTDADTYVDFSLLNNASDTVFNLLSELSARVHDKYQFKLLEIAIPEVLKHPIFENTLKVKHIFVKKSIKPNGFVSLYYYLITQDGKIIELQAQSRKRYRDSKIGPSDHNSIEAKKGNQVKKAKKVNIIRFFEPTSPNTSEEDFKKIFDFLDNMQYDRAEFLLNTDDINLTPSERREKRRLNSNKEAIKLKDSFEFYAEYTDTDGKKIHKTYTQSIDDYLVKFAEFYSPDLYAFGSPHTRHNTSVAGYNEKSLVTNFKEILLKHDKVCYLSHILIDRLEKILSPDKNTISKSGIMQRAQKRLEEQKKNNKSDSNDELSLS